MVWVVSGIKILVTGANGFIGGYLVEAWEKHPYYQLVVLTRKNPLNSFTGKTVMGDLAEGIPLDYPVDAIVHCAAQSPAAGIRLEDYIRSNVIAVRNLLDYAQRFHVHKFIFLSSMSVYGQVYEAIVDEDTAIVNPEPYGLTKYLGEMLLAEQKDWLDTMVLRLPGVLGPGAKTPWLARIAQRLILGQSVEIFNPEACFNNMVHVADLTRFIEHLLENQQKGYKVLTLACIEGLSVEETVLTLKKEMASSSQIELCPASSRAFSISIKKAQLEGYDPMTGRELLQKYAWELIHY